MSLRYLVGRLAFFALLLFSPTLWAAEPSHYVLVSVAPHKFFAEKIGGDTITVGLMVPAGASSHTYEPTPKQMITASRADIWFCIGESFEERAIRSLTAYNSTMQIVNMRKNVDMINADPQSGHCCCCHANSQDLHFWLSARQAKIQANTIAEVLSERYPEHAVTYRQRLASLVQELDALDQEIIALLKPLKNRNILVSHPAYAYFCRDYNLNQMSIEFEGKDPTPQQLTMLLQRARAASIHKVLIQAQYPSKGARLFAQQVNATVIMLDPYAEDYMNSMREIAQQIANDD